MYSYETILGLNVCSVQHALRQQICDTSHAAHGAFLSDAYAGGLPSADHVSNAAFLAMACQVYLAPGSPMEDDADLLRRIRASIAFQRRWQRPSGLIDLVVRNFESPPDTAFTVEALAHVVAAARGKTPSRGAQIVAEELGQYVRTAAIGLIDHGLHTPNHRWVVCSALALGMSLYPEIQGRPYIDSILAEGIDIQEDGEYTERSNGVYNAVCNRCFRELADCLGKPELLDPVRKNLDFMMHMLHEDGSVVTSFSTRQDQGLRVVPLGAADSFFDMAQRDGNGVWAQVADDLLARTSHESDRRGSSALLQPFLACPAYCHDRLPRRPLPDQFARHFPASGLWRVKRGPLSAVAMTGQRSVLALRFGQVSLRSVKISGSYHGHGHVRATEMQPIEKGVRLIHRGVTTDFAGFFLPLGRPVPFGTFKDAEKLRDRWSLPELNQTIDIVEVEDGFDLRMRSEGGMDRVPMEVEFAFELPGEWETGDTVIQAKSEQSVVLKANHGTFRVGDQAISIGPGSAATCDWNMRESQPTTGVFRVLVTFQTPFDRTLAIRYGYWSLATRSLIGSKGL